MRYEDVRLVSGIGVFAMACFAPYQYYAARVGFFLIGIGILTERFSLVMIGQVAVLLAAVWEIRKDRMRRRRQPSAPEQKPGEVHSSAASATRRSSRSESTSAPRTFRSISRSKLHREGRHATRIATQPP
jgi:hypothetical protein